MSIHLKELKHGDLGEATIIVGDPGRVSLIAEAFDKRSICLLYTSTGSFRTPYVEGKWLCGFLYRPQVGDEGALRL